ncbi:MAG: hypothetical protein R3Y05_04425 [bacterium]
MLNIKIIRINTNNKEANTLLETTPISSLQIYLKNCMRLAQEKNQKFKFTLSLQKRLNKPLEQKIYNTFIVDKNYVPTEYIKQFLPKDF